MQSLCTHNCKAFMGGTNSQKNEICLSSPSNNYEEYSTWLLDLAMTNLLFSDAHLMSDYEEILTIRSNQLIDLNSIQ